MDELIRAERTARRGLAFALLVTAALFGSLFIAGEVYMYFFMDFSGLG
jgi:heme/copper-type cytochrome/quinol oxidase subunit 3